MKHSHVPKALVALIAMACCSGTLFAQARADDFGKREFETKCASGHGASGRGDGQMVKLLQGRRPPDLRGLAKGNAGIFPINLVCTSIEGVDVPGHGSRDMPVWGDEYRAKAGQGAYNPDAWVRIRILALIEYIMRLQVRRPYLSSRRGLRRHAADSSPVLQVPRGASRGMKFHSLPGARQRRPRQTREAAASRRTALAVPPGAAHDIRLQFSSPVSTRIGENERTTGALVSRTGMIMEQGKAWLHTGHLPDGVLKSGSQIGFIAPTYLQKFIDDYLALRHYELTDANRDLVAQGIEQYGGGNLVLPSELVVFLDNLYRENSI